MGSVNNFEMLPEYKPIEELERIQDKMRSFLNEWGADLAEGVYIADWPELSFVDMGEEGEPKKEDFKGSIVIKKGSGILSTPFNPFPKGRAKICIKKYKEQVGKLIVGENVCLNGTNIVSLERVEIGNNVLFGANVLIMDTDGHVIDRSRPDNPAEHVHRPVIIKDDAWIGWGAIIMKGVTIGKQAIVAANSVVTKDVPDNCVAAGNPAKVIKEIVPKD